MEPDLIHLTEYAAQPGDVQILCTGAWTSVAWGTKSIVRKDLGLGGGIYCTVDDLQYTFADPVATCPECIQIKLKKHKEEVAKLKAQVAKSGRRG